MRPCDTSWAVEHSRGSILAPQVRYKLLERRKLVFYFTDVPYGAQSIPVGGAAVEWV